MEVRQVNAGNGWNWISGGFAIFKQSPVIWIALFFIYLLLGMALSVIPHIGLIVFNLLAPVFMAGFMLGCRALEMGEELEINHLFAGFKQNTAQLITVGGIYLAALIVIVGVVLLASGVAPLSPMMAEDMMSGQHGAAAGGKMLLILLFVLAAMVPLYMAYWFAPTLVLFHDMKALDAMKLSFVACLRNILPFVVYSLISMLLLLVATIPLGLGLLVMIPTMTASLYVSYKDIFGIQLAEQEGAAAKL
jgi:uncharacterized membrane protein